MNASFWFKKYHRTANYISAAMLYLKENHFLEKTLFKSHIKKRILGHWGTVPGLNFIYGGINYLISSSVKDKKFNKYKWGLVCGPGHGAPAIIAGTFIDGSLSKFYPKRFPFSEDGLRNLIKSFSWPSGLPSHTYPGVPGSINEGGELGYSLATAFGSVLDKPDLISVCVVGDGEAETATLAASWQSNKFLNYETDGIVLPILHLNGYKISGPTLFSTMTDEEIASYFSGLGYKVYIVDQYKLGEEIYEGFLQTLESVKGDLIEYKAGPSSLPMIVLKTKKGWTGPEVLKGKKIEDNNLSHGIPLQHPTTDDEEFKLLKEWLTSYKFKELLASKALFNNEVLEFIPSLNNALGNLDVYNNAGQFKSLILPKLQKHSINVTKPGTKAESRMEEMSEYLRDLFSLNEKNKNFRLFSPDESESNLLEATFDVTDRDLNRNVRKQDNDISKKGRIMEILSENVLQGWMEGYVKTNRHGLYVSYEAFLNIITSQLDQYIKYLRQSFEIPWRQPIPGLNYISTSTGWRQEHNGFTHQNPTLINSLLTKQADFVSIYFPSDVNTLLVTLETCLQEKDRVNLIIACKRDLPQWLSLEEAKEHVKRGISIWDWASNKRDMLSNLDASEDQFDIVLSSAGDYQTNETLAAAQILKELIPELKFQYVNVNEITHLGLGDENDPILSSKDFEKYFAKNKTVIFNFHGYPDVIKQLTWNKPIAKRLIPLGYIEHGTTTTPFDMQVLNKTSRYHVCLQAIIEASKVNPIVSRKAAELIEYFMNLLEKHKEYIVENGEDIPEVRGFKLNL